MQVTQEQVDPCKIALTITVEPEKVKTANDKAFAQFAKDIQLPGFRRGKVPPHMARAYVDAARVKQKAAEMVVGPAYVEALKETEIEPFGNLQPDLEMVEYPDGGPMVFKALVPLRPVITLGLYKGLELERRRLEVTDADVDRQIEEILTRHAEYPEVEGRSAQTGDIILADLTAQIEGEDVPDLAEPKGTVIEIGKNIPDFDSGLVGMEIGETKIIDALYPDTFPDEKMRGKRATFTVTLKELRAKNLPELTDEFVQKVHPSAKTESELRVAIHESLAKAADEMADNELEYNLVTKIVDGSQIFFPDALLRAEVEDEIRQLQEKLKQENQTIEDFLETQGRTAEEVEGEIREGADRRIRNSLALSEVARTEAITVDDDDVDKQIAERAERARVSPAAVRAYAEKNNQLGQFRDQALTEKILLFLKDASIVTNRMVTGDELRELEAKAEAEATVAAELENAELDVSEEAAAPLALEGAVATRRRKSDGADDVSDANEAAPAEGAGDVSPASAVE